MALNDSERTQLRRETYDLKEHLFALLVRLVPADPEAAAAIMRARSAVFEAWTILCMPPESEDEDHDH